MSALGRSSREAPLIDRKVAEAMRHQQAEVRPILDNQDALGRISPIPFELL